MFGAAGRIVGTILAVQRDLKMFGAPRNKVSERALSIITDVSMSLSEKASELETHLRLNGKRFTAEAKGFDFATALVLISQELFPNDPICQGQFISKLIFSSSLGGSIRKNKLASAIVTYLHSTSTSPQVETALFVTGLAQKRHSHNTAYQLATAKVTIEDAIGENQGIVETVEQIIKQQQFEMSACQIARTAAVGFRTLAPTTAAKAALGFKRAAEQWASLTSLTSDLAVDLPWGTYALTAAQAGIGISQTVAKTLKEAA